MFLLYLLFVFFLLFLFKNNKINFNNFFVAITLGCSQIIGTEFD